MPFWNTDESTNGKSILVLTEQGFGDVFQFSRYLNHLSQRFLKVGFVCSIPTLRLMEWSFNQKVTLFTHLPHDFSGWDMQCSLMSLPRLCKTRIDTIPNNAPYLTVPSPVHQHWLDRLSLRAPSRLRVGIAWAGRPAHQYDARRSLRFEQILPLLQIPAITWVSLQKWAPQDARPDVPNGVDWIDWTDELHDFGDTAGLVQNLDLVISIDSSMVHLAGALNRPVWMLNRFDSEWRWLDRRSDSPWYPSLHIFNQASFGDWGNVIKEVSARLQSLPRANTPIVNRKDSPERKIASNQAVLSQNTLTVDHALQLANQLQLSGRLNEAEKVLRGILQINPDQAHALHLLGIVTYMAGQYLLGIDLIKQAVEHEPNSALFESNLTEMLRQQGRVEEAIEHGLRSVIIDPTMASACSNLGVALFDAERYDDAETYHKKALSLSPNLIQFLNNLGSIERARENKVQALEWYRKALTINPEFLEALTNIDAILVEDERPQEAIEPLLKVLSAYPNSPEALCNLGLAYFKLDDFEKAENLLRRSLESRPQYCEAMIGIARVMQEIEKRVEAEEWVERALAIKPQKIDAWLLLGNICLESFNPKKAEAAFTRALELDPKNADAHTGVANLKLEAGEIAESEAILKRALELDPKSLGARFHLCQVKKVKKSDSNLKELESLFETDRFLSHDKKSRFIMR